MGRILRRDFYDRDTEIVARELAREDLGGRDDVGYVVLGRGAKPSARQASSPVRAATSTQIADIFHGNAIRNGLLPIVVDPERHAQLFELLAAVLRFIPYAGPWIAASLTSMAARASGWALSCRWDSSSSGTARSERTWPSQKTACSRVSSDVFLPTTTSTSTTTTTTREAGRSVVCASVA